MSMSEPLDQSKLSPVQDQLMMQLSVIWSQAQESEGRSPDLLVRAVNQAEQVLREGSPWPDDRWVENILMIGGNSAYHAVVGCDRYPEVEESLKALYQEVLDRRWLQGGPSGQFDADDCRRMGEAAAYWQKYTDPGTGAGRSSDSGDAASRVKGLGVVAHVIGTAAAQVASGEMPADYFEFTVDNQRMELHRLVSLIVEDADLATARRIAADAAQEAAGRDPGAAQRAVAAIDELLAELHRPTDPPSQWAADPTGRHQMRYWNGTEWTAHVADNGSSSTDPM